MNRIKLLENNQGLLLLDFDSNIKFGDKVISIRYDNTVRTFGTFEDSYEKECIKVISTNYLKNYPIIINSKKEIDDMVENKRIDDVVNEYMDSLKYGIPMNDTSQAYFLGVSDGIRGYLKSNPTPITKSDLNTLITVNMIPTDVKIGDMLEKISPKIRYYVKVKKVFLNSKKEVPVKQLSSYVNCKSGTNETEQEYGYVIEKII